MGGGGGPTTYSGAICIANKQNLLKRGGGGVQTPPLDLPLLWCNNVWVLACNVNIFL